MLGRLPKNEVHALKALLLHKAEEATHGGWAKEDYLKLGGTADCLLIPPPPECFAVTAVWWQMARTESPFGYLGAEYLFEYLTAQVCQDLVAHFKRQNIAHTGLRFIAEHAVEDEKHTRLIKEMILDFTASYDEAEAAVERCFDLFAQVYPLPVWSEAYGRAVKRVNQ